MTLGKTRKTVQLAFPLLIATTFCQLNGQSSKVDSKVLVYSAAYKPATNTTGYQQLEVQGFNIFRFNGGTSLQDIVVEPARGPFRPASSLLKAQPSIPPGLVETLDGIKLNTQIDAAKTALDKEPSEQQGYRDLLVYYPGKVLLPQDERNLRLDLHKLRDGARPIVTVEMVADLRAAYNALGSKPPEFDAKLTALEGRVSTPEGAALAAYLDRWRNRADFALDPAHWIIGPIPLTCQAQWFGRTDAQAISLITADQKDDVPSETTTVIATNACVPVLTITSGLGLSFVRNSTFTMVPKTDYSLNPPATTQVIGYASDQSVVPLYVIQMNYGIGRAKAFQVHGAGGAGVSSSGAGTNADFFAGPAFSFARRAIFVAPSIHLTQRQTLQDGYSVGNPKADLNTVPTINRWKYGFALTITFPVLSK